MNDQQEKPRPIKFFCGDEDIHEEAIEQHKREAADFPEHDAVKCEGQLCPIHTPELYQREIQNRLESQADRVALEVSKFMSSARLSKRYYLRTLANVLQGTAAALNFKLEEVFVEGKKLQDLREREVASLKSQIAKMGIDEWVKSVGAELISMSSNAAVLGARVRDYQQIYSVLIFEKMGEAAEALKVGCNEAVKIAHKIAQAEQETPSTTVH